MPSSAQTMLSADKSSPTPALASLSECNYSERALRTYLQQSPAHSSLEPPLQSLLPPSKSARAVRHESSRPFQSGALLVSLWVCSSTIQLRRIVRDEEAYFFFFVCALLQVQPSKCPDSAFEGVGGLKQRIRQRGWDKESNLCPSKSLSGLLLSHSDGPQLKTSRNNRKAHPCCVLYQADLHRSLNCRSESVCMRV